MYLKKETKLSDNRPLHFNVDDEKSSVLQCVYFLGGNAGSHWIAIVLITDVSAFPFRVSTKSGCPRSFDHSQMSVVNSRRCRLISGLYWFQLLVGLRRSCLSCLIYCQVVAGFGDIQMKLIWRWLSKSDNIKSCPRRDKKTEAAGQMGDRVTDDRRLFETRNDDDDDADDAAPLPPQQHKRKDAVIGAAREGNLLCWPRHWLAVNIRRTNSQTQQPHAAVRQLSSLGEHRWCTETILANVRV